MSRLLELEALAQDFANWRRSKTTRGSKIPRHLKAKVIELSPYFKRIIFYKTLRISASSFYKWRLEYEQEGGVLQSSGSKPSLSYGRLDVSLGPLVSIPESVVSPRPQLAQEGSHAMRSQSCGNVPLASLTCGAVSIEFFSTQALVAVCQNLSLGGGQ
jgi:hypothetical protein